MAVSERAQWTMLAAGCVVAALIIVLLWQPWLSRYERCVRQAYRSLPPGATFADYTGCEGLEGSPFEFG